MRVRVAITRRPEIADPEGATVKKALTDLGYNEVRTVRFDRSIILDLEENDATRARDRAVEMCNRLLVNPVLEEYTVEVET
ncbi:MAG TPA: phosphoribosylformylglycinamidine synthase subunit PurS [Acidimicrobiia bacterium]|nr:phosphoribosylformylglycinamidine synthase subunit PurS [Acidimicrobiia bacterium]